MRQIGYYVHHQGDGHRQRALAIAAIDPQRFTLLGTQIDGRTDGVRAVALPDDRIASESAFDGDDNEHHRPRSLHYAPLFHEGMRTRMATIAQWIATTRPALMVIDVSVEVAMLARLCATPTAYVRLGGHRDDPAHLEAFRAASVLIAPFAPSLDDPRTPLWIEQKSIYAPGLVSHPVTAEPRSGSVLVVCGRGGSPLPISNLADAARSTPDRRWRVIGRTFDMPGPPSNLEIVGWSDDAASEIAHAEIVVGAAGDGLVGAVLAARRPFICIPEPRPFDEQVQKATALQRAQAAIVLGCWPAPERWPDILSAACALDPAHQARLDDPGGAARLSRRLIALADGQK